MSTSVSMYVYMPLYIMLVVCDITAVAGETAVRLSA
jgi:hypothetical protein